MEYVFVEYVESLFFFFGFLTGEFGCSVVVFSLFDSDRYLMRMFIVFLGLLFFS